MDPKAVQEMIEQVGGNVTSGAILPDGHAFMTASFPLPKNHWIYENDEGFCLPPPMPFRMGTDDPRRKEWAEKIMEAAKYAVRASTMNGKDEDFDPDALIRNMVTGMLGYNTSSALSTEDWGNPKPIPEPYK